MHIRILYGHGNGEEKTQSEILCMKEERYTLLKLGGFFPSILLHCCNGRGLFVLGVCRCSRNVCPFPGCTFPVHAGKLRAVFVLDHLQIIVWDLDPLVLVPELTACISSMM